MNVIHLQRLYFRGRENQRRQVVADLDRVAWPALGEREYLFIKQLQAKTSAGQLALQLVEQASAYRYAAVNGWSAAAASAPAVYFSCFAELLACLTRDLLQRNYYWYWRQWSDLFERPVETALCDCWHEQHNLIPAVIFQLARHDQLSWFCRQLSAGMADRLCLALFPSLDLSTLPDLACSQNRTDTAIPPVWLAPWQPVFADSKPPLQVWRLAALIIAQEWQPLKLLQGDIHPQLKAIGGGLLAMVKHEARAGDDEPKVQNQPTPVFNRQAANSHQREDSMLVTSARQNPQDAQIKPALSTLSFKTPNQAGGERPVVLNPNQSRVTESHPQKNLIEAMRSNSLLKDAALDGYSQQVQAEGLNPLSPKTGFEYPTRCWTEQGGLFYLLNFLNLSQVQDSLLSNAVSRSYPSAWGWLWQLARAMEWEAEAGLKHLFAFFCGFANEDELAHLPALPQIDDLLLWGRQRYGEELFNKNLFRVDALIEIDAGHVDIFYVLNSVRLEVRRAGLDIDPGWLPWLGKVVKFHYGPLPAL